MQFRRRAGGRHSRLALLVVPAALVLPAPAVGQVGLVDDPRAVGVALSGPDVLVVSVGRHGRVAIDAVPRGGGPVRQVFSLPGRKRIARASLVASPRLAALLVEMEPADWRLYAGPPAGPLDLVMRFVWTSRQTWIPVDHAVDGETVLLHELRLQGWRSRVRVLAPGVAPEVMPWSGAYHGPATIAGGVTAFLSAGNVHVADWRTGSTATTVPVGDPDDVLWPGSALCAARRRRSVSGGGGAPRGELTGAARPHRPDTRDRRDGAAQLPRHGATVRAWQPRHP